jgi:AbrB family looped-hinge helix DNA binding protein
MYYKYYVSGGDGMRLNSKGQVTIPAHLREQYGLHEGDEVDVIEDGGAARSDPRSRASISARMRRSAGTGF